MSCYTHSEVRYKMMPQFAQKLHSRNCTVARLRVQLLAVPNWRERCPKISSFFINIGTLTWESEVITDQNPRAPVTHLEGRSGVSATAATAMRDPNVQLPSRRDCLSGKQWVAAMRILRLCQSAKGQNEVLVANAG